MTSTTAVSTTATSSISPATTPELGQEIADWLLEAAVNDTLDVCDTNGVWRPGRIVEIRDHGLHIQYLNHVPPTTVTPRPPWELEWIGRASERLSEMGSKYTWTAEDLEANRQAQEAPSTAATTTTPGATATSSSSTTSSSSSGTVPAAAAVDWRAALVQGSQCDCLDTSNSWYTSTIRDVRDDQVFVHYHCWGERWDEWMARSSDRIQALGTRCAVTVDTTPPLNLPPPPGGYTVPLTPAQRVAKRWRDWAAYYDSSNLGLGFKEQSESSTVKVAVDPTSSASSSGYPRLVESVSSTKADVAATSGYALRKPVTSASAIPAPPSAPSTAAEFIKQRKLDLLSRTSYAKLVHLLTPTLTTPKAELMQLAHKILTGQSLSSESDGFKIPLASPQQSDSSGASSFERSYFTVDVSGATGSPAAGAIPLAPAPVYDLAFIRSTAPNLAYYDSSRTTLLMRLIQLYHLLDEREQRAIFRSYLPIIADGLKTYDINHQDSLGRTTLHWCLLGAYIPRPGGLLFELIRMLLEAGAKPNMVTKKSESALSLLVGRDTGVGSVSFDLLAPILNLLRAHGLEMNECDEFGNTMLHRLILSSKNITGLLEECISNSMTTGYDFFQPNHEGMTVMDLLADQLAVRPDDSKIQLSVRLLLQYMETWATDIKPWINTELLTYLPEPLCNFILEYCDGSGKYFQDIYADTGLTFAEYDLNPASDAAPLKAWNDFAIGDQIDAFDTAQRWYLSTITNIRPDAVFVHYNGWPNNWDEWLPFNSPRLAARGSHAHEYGNLPNGQQQTLHQWGGGDDGFGFGVGNHRGEL